MSLFGTYQLSSIKIFLEKPNWKSTLNFLAEGAFRDKFFFFFDTERGQNLSIYAENFSDEHITELQRFIDSLPRHYLRQPEDFLFANFRDRTILSINKIPVNFDIEIPTDIENAFDFQKKLGNVIIGALNYNDFFLEEKNRINLALQLVFLSMIRAKRAEISKSLKSIPEIQKVDEGLKAFFSEIQDIEKEGNLEKWVVDWLEITATIKSISALEFMIESVCQTLEIRSFSKNLTYTLYAILSDLDCRA